MIEKKTFKVGQKMISVPEKDGYTPVEYLKEVNSARRPRSIAMDSRYRSSRTFPTPTKAEDAARWVAHPNIYDIEGIDTPFDPSIRPITRKVTARPKKQVMDVKDLYQEFVEAYCKRMGKDVTTNEEFVMSTSLDFKWMSPSQAKKMLKLLMDKGYMVQRGGFIRPSTWKNYAIDVSYVPPKSIIPESGDNFIERKVDPTMPRVWGPYEDVSFNTITEGDYVKTPRYGDVKISDKYGTEFSMRNAGYREPTGYKGRIAVNGRHITKDAMKYACCPSDTVGKGSKVIEKPTGKTYIYDWYSSEDPYDKYKRFIPSSLTFDDLYDGIRAGKPVGDILGTREKKLVEKVLDQLAKIMDVSPSYVYEMIERRDGYVPEDYELLEGYDEWWNEQLGASYKKKSGKKGIGERFRWLFRRD